MKQKLIDVFNKYKWSPTETWLTCDIISEKDFDGIAEDLVKLFAIPVVSGSYSIEDELKDKINKSLIDEKLEPIKCECGSTNFNDQTRDMLNYEVVEKDRYCDKCGKLVGYWSYGSWLP